ncbi:MAG: bifunctional 2-polyprenyl-6-hydroxyphenol methylase/3-demethylubiquinol 3-O-methyltransferase UbiG [Gammaproteobacteria bacterium]|nr:bifunctional 2-polyprenyl-6-hydroxyphenol methylase/3-demethylubiquinol 3-O-methyltransferase UbiG [Gammaproteobacteria bacterium]
MSNVDALEIQKFEKLASRWWDPRGEFKPLHDINPLRLGFINERAPLAGRNVIDVGCGGGLLTEAMSELGARVTGIDLGEAPLAVARLHLKETGHTVDYHHTSAEEWADGHAGEYDVVTCLELLEHVPDPASTVAACAKLAAPGGTVFFSTINRNPKAWVFAILGAEYVFGLLPRGTHDYARLIRPSELDAWCRNADLDVREMTGMHYNPLTRRYWLAPGLDVNYIACARSPKV